MIPDEGMDQKDFSIYFRLWDQQNWQLSEKIEMIVNKNMTAKELSEILSVNDDVNKIVNDPNEMCICRILSIHKFNIIDLTEMEVILLLILVVYNESRPFSHWRADVCQLRWTFVYLKEQ